MDTTNEKEVVATALETRVKSINDATNGLFAAAMKAAKDDGAGKEFEPILTAALTLVNCGLIALTEIADAQQRMAALAEADLSVEIDTIAKDKAELIAGAMVAETSKRSFIGQK